MAYPVESSCSSSAFLLQDYNALADVDVVIEAVFEDMAIKKKVSLTPVLLGHVLAGCLTIGTPCLARSFNDWIKCALREPFFARIHPRWMWTPLPVSLRGPIRCQTGVTT